MIRLVTVEREFGSGASDIARKLSEKLGWKLWDESLTNEVAQHFECGKELIEQHGERQDPLYHRLFKAFLRGSYEGTMNAQRLKMVDAEQIRVVSERIVRRIAQSGNSVIVGRGSAYYLHALPDAFHVFIYAPFEERVRRLREAGHSHDSATQLAETVDRERAEFIKQYFGLKWPDRYYFHLMINSKVGDECAVDTILHEITRVKECALTA